MKIGKWILNNFWLKLLSLLLAVFTWFYVVNLIEDATGSKTILTKVLPSYSKLVSKKLFIKAVFAGTLPEKYELLVDEVKIDPPYFVVAGQSGILEKIDKLETLPIDISKYRRTTSIDVQISPIAESVDTEKISVKVTIPVKKIESEEVKSE